jgi:uncharacterized repeat protein (TIGR01451 family)
MQVSRWRGAVVAALVAMAVGFAVGDPATLALALVPLAYVVFSYAAGLGPPDIRLERRLDAERTRPGESVTVELTVENTGDHPIPDLRVVDGVPPDVPVVEGSPRACVALRPGERVTVEYALRPPRGSHEFGPVAVRGRSLAATVVGTDERDGAGAATLVCETLLDDVPLHEQATPLAGQLPVDAGGRGVEFYAVRDYRRGDPLNRVDWKRLARTGRLATVESREERAAAVIFVVDGRTAAAVTGPQGGPTAVDLGAYAAARGVVALTADGHRVGVATLDEDGVAEWVSPGRGEAEETAVEAALERTRTGERPEDADGTAAGVAAQPTPDGGQAELDPEAVALSLAGRLPASAQVVLCSPLVDDLPLTAAQVLRQAGHGVTVLSPDLTGDRDTPGRQVAGLRRQTRVAALQRAGVPVASWDPETPLHLALAAVVTGRWPA